MPIGTLRTIRARPGTVRPPSIAELLYDQQANLDALLHDLSGGIRSPQGYDALEARASAIADGVRGAFRTGARR